MPDEGKDKAKPIKRVSVSHTIYAHLEDLQKRLGKSIPILIEEMVLQRVGIIVDPESDICKSCSLRKDKDRMD